MLFGSNDNGQKSLVNINRVTNGWLVTVHHYNRDKEISPETLARRNEERQQEILDQKEREKKRIVREMTLQLANMAIIGEAAGKAQHKGIQEELEPWKMDEEETADDPDSSENPLQKIEAIAEKIANEASTERNAPLSGALSNFIGGICDTPGVETHIFTERAKMIEFVSQMLQPVVE